MVKKIIYVDMDDVLCDYTNAHQKMLLENPSIKYPQSKSGFFRDLTPLQHAVESINFFQNHTSFEIYVLTAPSVYNPLSYSEKRLWIENHLGFAMVERLIISCNKGLNKGDYLIDDYIEGRGQENFEGKLMQFGSPGFPDWKAIISYFKEHYPV